MSLTRALTWTTWACSQAHWPWDYHASMAKLYTRSINMQKKTYISPKWSKKLHANSLFHLRPADSAINCSYCMFASKPFTKFIIILPYQNLSYQFFSSADIDLYAINMRGFIATRIHKAQIKCSVDVFRCNYAFYAIFFRLTCSLRTSFSATI